MSKEQGLGGVRPVIPPVAGRGLPATDQRTLAELVAINDPLNPGSGQREALLRDNPQVVPAQQFEHVHTWDEFVRETGKFRCTGCQAIR